jgi:transcriptional regulator with XRE-family HTH domain
MTFPEKLLTVAQQRNISQSDIVRALSGGPGRSSKDVVSRWFTGRSKPNVYAGLALARYLEVPMEWLVDDAMDGPPEGWNERDRAVLAAIRARERIEGRELTAEELIWRIFRPVDGK